MARSLPTHAKRSPRVVGVVVGCVLAALLGSGIAVGVVHNRPDAVASGPTNSPAASGTISTSQPNPTVTAETPSPTPTATVEPTVTFNFVAVGDVLPHRPVLDSARKGKSYDFAPLFAPTKPYIQGADLSICHLEVPIAPPGTQPSSYPIFSAPVKLVADLAKVGWDGCSTASNHSVDRGYAGIKATNNAFQAADLGHAGTARTKHEAAQVQFYSVEEGGRTIKVAHIAYTYGLNGLPKPAGKPWSVNVFNADTANVTPILNAAKKARKDGADIVIASVHCCVEYVTQPTAAQKRIAEKIADSGLVDLYIGHHAHVPEPIVKLDGGPGGKGMWVAYGLGNYVSNQDASTVGVAETANGVMLRATFTVSPDDEVDVDVGWTALTVDRTGGHVVYPISKHSGAVGKLSAATVAARWKLVAHAVGKAAPEITKPGEPLADEVTHNNRKP